MGFIVADAARWLGKRAMKLLRGARLVTAGISDMGAGCYGALGGTQFVMGHFHE